MPHSHSNYEVTGNSFPLVEKGPYHWGDALLLKQTWSYVKWKSHITLEKSTNWWSPTGTEIQDIVAQCFRVKLLMLRGDCSWSFLPWGALWILMDLFYQLSALINSMWSKSKFPRWMQMLKAERHVCQKARGRWEISTLLCCVKHLLLQRALCACGKTDEFLFYETVGHLLPLSQDK